MYVHVCMYVCAYMLYVLVSAHVCLRACRFMWCIWMFLEVFVCVHAGVFMHVCLCVHVPMCVLCVFMYMWVYVCEGSLDALDTAVWMSPVENG